MKIKPLSDRILVRYCETPSKSPGGIVLPDSARDKPRKGEVLAVGPGRVLDNGQLSTMQVKVGNVVLFSLYGGNAIGGLGEEKDLVILREDDILAVEVE